MKSSSLVSQLDVLAYLDNTAHTSVRMAASFSVLDSHVPVWQKRRQWASGTCLLPAPLPGPPSFWKRMGSEGIPAAHGEEAANTGVSSLGVWQLVLRINAIYEARRGKKRVKRLSQSTESNSGKGRSIPTTIPPPPEDPETDSS